MKGEVVYLYAFDVANEIATQQAEQILASKLLPFELRRDHTLPKDVPLYRPLAIHSPPLTAPLAGQQVRVRVHVYQVGVVSISMRAAFDVSSLADLLPYHKSTLDDGAALGQAALNICTAVCNSLTDMMIDPARPSEPEAYTVFCLTDVGTPDDATTWLTANGRGVAELLTESPPGVLSDTQVPEVLRVRRSYSKNDAVVIDWDAALVVDLDGYVDDVLYVLELSNLQLEEYRVIDQRLDRYLDRVYEDLRRRKFGLFGTYSATLRTLRLVQVDVTKLNDEVTHISKFFGDWYLARVYLGAGERFYLNQWRQSVADRLSQLDRLYSVVNSDINNRRMIVLEVLVVIFFAVDLLMIAFWRR
jgi:hypothetical protein